MASGPGYVRTGKVSGRTFKLFMLHSFRPSGRRSTSIAINTNTEVRQKNLFLKLSYAVTGGIFIRKSYYADKRPRTVEIYTSLPDNSDDDYRRKFFL